MTKKPTNISISKVTLQKNIKVQTLEKVATILPKKCQDLSHHQSFPKYGFDQNSDKKIMEL